MSKRSPAGIALTYEAEPGGVQIAAKVLWPESATTDQIASALARFSAHALTEADKRIEQVAK